MRLVPRVFQRSWISYRNVLIPFEPKCLWLGEKRSNFKATPRDHNPRVGGLSPSSATKNQSHSSLDLYISAPHTSFVLAEGGSALDLELKDKVALVTGASRGIGRAIASGFAAEGAKLVIAARGQEALDQAAAELEAVGADVLTVSCDVSDDADVRALAKAALERFGRIDILVSNASALAVGGSREDWDKSLSVDLLGAVRLVDAVLPGMRGQGSGSILLVSSVSAVEASPMDDYGYTAAKAALNAYAKKLAVNEAANGIRANALLPGSVEFPGGGWDVMRAENPPIYEMVRSSIPFGRLGKPEEIADAAVWLVSARANWVTGAALSVDGGQGKGIR